MASTGTHVCVRTGPALPLSSGCNGGVETEEEISQRRKESGERQEEKKWHYTLAFEVAADYQMDFERTNYG